jgi:hypothetical protein
MAKKKTDNLIPVTNFRLSEDVLHQLDLIAERVPRPPGMKPRRVDGLRFAADAVARGRLRFIGELGAGPSRDSPAEADEFLHLHQIYPSGVVVYRVRGNSMKDALIADGDYVVVQPCQLASNGQTVVYHLADNGCVVKRFDEAKGVLHSGTGKGMWEHPIGPGDRLLGVLVGVIRRV